VRLPGWLRHAGSAVTCVDQLLRLEYLIDLGINHGAYAFSRHTFLADRPRHETLGHGRGEYEESLKPPPERSSQPCPGTLSDRFRTHAVSDSRHKKAAAEGPFRKVAGTTEPIDRGIIQKLARLRPPGFFAI
jgi:hypothetical protein